MDKPALPPDPLIETALRSLKDIAPQQPVSWFPQTWGWLALVVVLVALITVLLVRQVKHYRANRYRREALLELQALEREILDPAKRQQAMRALAALLKRTALAAWPRDDVASLSGAAWIHFLRSQEDDGVADALATLLNDFEYHGDGSMKTMPFNIAGDVVASARQWIERHHVSA
ncbi:DUF4381 domain-containing protein [Rhizobium rhizogenes]|jgi:hypothetical protein|uniref:DUF4381 domain-containing protein n=1 Tax=Rhizobium rhizogenes TaxID=359 RepID=UPI0004DB1D41|nr:DUF4381 domain-containing protein [Rhizobium rhizogenes]KEA09353.1 hypothetical protein CN09_17245 [Rhizobium rhizogenes]MQB34994.1 DUF4381 domain-containing protein [Rhizobium rhizogenes]NTF70721.1 DUF4381 domain-containing protein [Rhizobium rhizogenes]NTI82579.1 DUF4381 domain-containing protein [Rhizobium rhizogenes]NTJ24761.1 DUF4381 domain-containing protein [Rhizobium rhizogenes]